MQEPFPQGEHFTVDLRIGVKPVILFLFATGAAIGLAGGTPDAVGKTMPVALAIEILALFTWWLDNRLPRLSPWMMTGGLIFVALLITDLLQNPLSLGFLLLPAVVSLALQGSRRALLSGGLVTGVVLACSTSGWQGVGAEETVALLVLIWFVLGVSLVIDRRVCGVTHWAWKQYQQANTMLEEARSQQARLLQTTQDLVQTTQQLAAMNDRLDAARRMAEEAQKSKMAFVANVSHEFRTPLNMIIGLTDLLVETPEVYGKRLPNALLEDLEIVRRNSEHLSAMITDVLDLSQVEAGRLALKKERVDLTKLIERAGIVVRPLLEKKKLSFTVDIPPDLPEIYCDLNRIRQVVVNLLSNAARFTEKGGIHIRVALLPHVVQVAVADTGPGIDPEEAQKLFVPFSQGESAQSQSPEQAGSGLGLAISKQFVDLHGGRMWLESQPGLGSTFFFRLPISPPMEPSVNPAGRLVESWSYFHRTERANLPIQPPRPRLIVCDETGDLLPLITRYLGEVDCVETHSAEETVCEFRKYPAQAVLVNASHPASLHPIMETILSALPDTQVYGFTFPARGRQALAAGACGYLTKPVTRADLKTALDGVTTEKNRGHIRRVLLVDDAPDELHLFYRLLLSIDPALQVTTATSGQATLDCLQSQRFDLVFLDIVMADMEGWQVLARKGQDPAIRDVPVIILSGRDPLDQPMASHMMMVGSGGGLSLGQALDALKALSAILPDGGILLDA